MACNCIVKSPECDNCDVLPDDRNVNIPVMATPSTQPDIHLVIDPAPERSSRTRIPSAAVRNPDNTAEFEIVEHQNARENRRAALEALSTAKRHSMDGRLDHVELVHKRTTSMASLSSGVATGSTSPLSGSGNDLEAGHSSKSKKAKSRKKKHKAKDSQSSKPSVNNVDSDIEMVNIDEVVGESRAEGSKDLDEFFDKPKTRTGDKKERACKRCQ
ncbi:hypothetical protein DL96DRAFT_1248452 [Flagelloscypha sp. PMI_526]|nr:hypothetical protein DL96DRAFT_1248452 [Flagelloscypha sp. PMI_526]